MLVKVGQGWGQGSHSWGRGHWSVGTPDVELTLDLPCSCAQPNSPFLPRCHLCVIKGGGQGRVQLGLLAFGGLGRAAEP